MSEETNALGNRENFFLVQDPTLVDAIARWKRCPLCTHIETDYENAFCTEDGTTLVWDQSEGASSRSSDPTINIPPNLSLEADSLTVEELRKATAPTVMLSFANATNAKRQLGHTKRYWIPGIVVIALLAILAAFSQCRRRSKS